MTSDQLRNAMAKAICKVTCDNPNEITVHLEDDGRLTQSRQWEYYLEEADAALAVALPVLRRHYVKIAKAYESRRVSTAIRNDGGPK